MSLFRPVDRHPRGGGDPASSAILHEAILASSSSVRDSLPEQHRAHFEILRQEIIDFAQAHNIPRESLAKPDALREAASKLFIPDLEHLADLLERFQYLLVNREPWKNKEALEYAEEYYHLEKQYDSQVSLLREVGILKEGAITGIDGNKYPIPTLEQIAVRLFERRETLETKHDQGFTKLLLVPFGMSLDTLTSLLNRFSSLHVCSFLASPVYKGADMSNPAKIIYDPKSFHKKDHRGKTKMQKLEDQAHNPNSFPGWTVHLLQPSNPSDQNSPGFAHVPTLGEGTSCGRENSRPDLEAGSSAHEYFSILQEAQNDPYSPYHHESGMTSEDWILACITHLKEIGRPLDDYMDGHESMTYLTGAFFPSIDSVPRASWNRTFRQIRLDDYDSHTQIGYTGARTSVII